MSEHDLLWLIFDWVSIYVVSCLFDVGHKRRLKIWERSLLTTAALIMYIIAKHYKK